MGMPACRITDTTAHGGVVVMGCPTVLIGGLPAARIGDNHVCPMVTVLVPHVGGPFVLGSMTVLVGGMPQSRVTDMLVCVGPPDIAAMGEPTVLVGMAGAGGMVSAMSGMQMSGFAAPSAPQAPISITASVLPAGGMQIAAPPGMSLPPITLQQPGWPDLPAAQTINFQSVQPVVLAQGTQLVAIVDHAVPAALPGYWMPALPANSLAQAQSAAQSEWNSAQATVTAVIQQAEGVKAWAGQAAQSAAQQASSAMNAAQQEANQAMQLAQQAGQQAAQQAQQAAAQASQPAQNIASAVPQIWAPASSMAQNAVRGIPQGIGKG